MSVLYLPSSMAMILDNVLYTKNNIKDSKYKKVFYAIDQIKIDLENIHCESVPIKIVHMNGGDLYAHGLKS